MTPTDPPDQLQDAFVRAAKIAEAVPEALRAIAFQRALDAVLGAPPQPEEDRERGRGAPPRLPSGRTTRRGAKRSTADGEGSQEEPDIVARLSELLDRTELADLMAGRKTLDRALLVLRAAQHHRIDAMTPSEIADVLTEKFRERTKESAVRMALERSPAYTDRRRRGGRRDGAVVYVLMGAGERYLDAPAGENTSLSDSTRQPNRPRQMRAGAGAAKRRRGAKPSTSGSGSEEAPPTSKRANPTPPAAAETGERSNGSARRSGGKPGPKAILEELLKEGLFDQPQTIGSLIDHIERKRGHRYKATDFGSTLARLLRERKLDRDRNGEGQYEYRRNDSA